MSMGVYCLSDANLKQIEQHMSIDIQNEVKVSYEEIYGSLCHSSESRTEFESDMFDVALEGTTFIWLKFPQMMID